MNDRNDLLDRISELVDICQRDGCTAPARDAPDFCSEDCQKQWQARFGDPFEEKPITVYRDECAVVGTETDHGRSVSFGGPHLASIAGGRVRGRTHQGKSSLQALQRAALQRALGL